MASVPKRRCFERDLMSMLNVVESKTEGQVKVVEYDQDLTKCYISVTPSGSDYAHAQFIFLIETCNTYPESGPNVVCTTPVFHPNIDHRIYERNLCVNVLSYWNKSYDLMTLVYALLYLFYEPNYDDPFCPSIPFDNETASDCVRRSLAGEVVHGVCYPVNTSWKAWMDNQSLENAKADVNVVQQPAHQDKTNQNSLFVTEIQPCSLQRNVVYTTDELVNLQNQNEIMHEIFNSIDLYQIDIRWISDFQDKYFSSVSRYYFAQSCVNESTIKLVCGPHIGQDGVNILNGQVLRLQRASYSNWTIERSHQRAHCEQQQQLQQSENNDKQSTIFIKESNMLYRLQPSTWLFYQTRWPFYLLPGYLLAKCLYDPYRSFQWPRASETRLMEDLLFYTNDLAFDESVHLVLIDPLALSPVSPLVNRLIPVRFPSSDHVDQLILLGIEWISPWFTLFPPVPHSHRHPYRLRGMAVLAWLAFVSNWFSWASRAELYQSVLGYSRPGLTPFSKSRRVTDAAALNMISFPCLACGQSALFDAWPLWMLSSLMRTGCRVLGALLGKLTCYYHTPLDLPIDPPDDLRRTWVFFPFTDADEI